MLPALAPEPLEQVREPQAQVRALRAPVLPAQVQELGPQAPGQVREPEPRAPGQVRERAPQVAAPVRREVKHSAVAPEPARPEAQRSVVETAPALQAVEHSGRPRYGLD